MLNNILEVSATFSKSFNASSNSLLSYRARAVTQVSISCNCCQQKGAGQNAGTNVSVRLGGGSLPTCFNDIVAQCCVVERCVEVKQAFVQQTNVCGRGWVDIADRWVVWRVAWRCRQLLK